MKDYVKEIRESIKGNGSVSFENEYANAKMAGLEYVNHQSSARPNLRGNMKKVYDNIFDSQKKVVTGGLDTFVLHEIDRSLYEKQSQDTQ